MRIVVGGAGEVGYHIARTLRSDDHEIVLIERDPEMVRRAKSLDVMVLEGNAASPELLDRAKIMDADLYIGVTGSDEVNLFGCALAAAKLTETIARVKNFDYTEIDEDDDIFDRVGIKKLFCPELVASDTIIKLISSPWVVDIETFGDGNIHIVQFPVHKKSKADGTAVKDLGLPKPASMVAIQRAGLVGVAKGNMRLMKGDRIVIIINDLNVLPELESLFITKKRRTRVKNVAVFGANNIGVRIAAALEHEKNVILIDESVEKAKAAAMVLKKILPVQGRPTDRKMMADINIGSVDVFIAVDEDERHNILACSMAKKLGASRTIAMVKTADLASILSDVGVDIVINPRWATIAAILQYTHQDEYLAVSLIFKDEAQILELEIRSNSHMVGKSIEKARLPEDSIVAAIVRRGKDEYGQIVRKTKIARKTDILMAGDKLIIFTMRDAIQKLKKALE